MYSRELLVMDGVTETCRVSFQNKINLRHWWLWLVLRKNVKVKCTVVQALWLCTGRTAHRGSRGVALLFLDHGTRGCEGSASRPGRSLPPGKTRYPLYRKLGGPQGRSGQVRKISPPPGFDPRASQPVASRYVDHATRPIWFYYRTMKILWAKKFRSCVSSKRRLYFVPIRKDSGLN